jgi:hypothetical protein
MTHEKAGKSFMSLLTLKPDKSHSKIDYGVVPEMVPTCAFWHDNSDLCTVAKVVGENIILHIVKDHTLAIKFDLKRAPWHDVSRTA